MVEPIHLDKMRETKNNGPTIVRLKNYIDFWIILQIKGRLDFDLWRSWKLRWIVSGSMIMYINCKCDD